ncbi:uncharacterized protein [Littorina saxatilis]|uniref:Ig-like domain-containing protein n=1 Tax=Littorina saxatilis TaxID=31220 RepID=A0AAN9BHU6_9CAEN
MDMLTVPLLVTVFVQVAEAVRLPNCRPDGTFDINTTLNKSDVICDEFSIDDVIVWSMTTSSGSEIIFGNCSANGACAIPPQNFVTLSRNIRSDNSTLKLNDVRDPVVGGVTITCSVQGDPTQSASCTLDHIYPAEVESCTVQTNTEAFTAELQCNISKVKSSIGRYQCLWYRGTSQASQVEFLDKTTFDPVPHDEPKLFKGSCSLTSNLFARGGSYYYRAVVYPGETEKVTEPIVLEEPAKPEMECTPNPWTASSTQLSCTCRTTSAGQPPGMLQYTRGGTGLVGSGEFGALALDLPPQTVSPDDLGKDTAFFTCKVQWAGNSPRDTHIVELEEDSSNLPLILGLTFGLVGGLLLLVLVLVIVYCCCCTKTPGTDEWSDRGADTFDDTYYRNEAHYPYSRQTPGGFFE